MAQRSWLILLSSDQPRSQRQARLQASRYGRGWTAGFPNLPKTEKDHGSNFQCNAVQFQHPLCHPASSPPFEGGSFYGRYLRSSPDEKVAIRSSHGLNVSCNCGALHYGMYGALSKRQRVLTHQQCPADVLKIILYISIYEYNSEDACLGLKLLGKSHTVERHARCWGSFGWPMGQQSCLSGRSKLWSPYGM